MPRFLYLRGGDDVDAVVAALGEDTVEVHDDIAELSARAGELERTGEPAEVAVIDVATDRPLSAATRVRRADRHIGVVLLAPASEVERVGQRVALSPEISDAEVVEATSDPDELGDRLEAAAGVSARRRELAGALDEMNVQLLQRRTGTAIRTARTVSERYLAALTRHAPDAIVSIDRDGRIVSFNDAATELFGVSAEEAEGRPVASLATADAADDLREMITLACEAAEDARGELRLLRGGESFIGAVTTAPIRDEHDDVIGVVFIVRDVTVHRRSEERLRHLQKAESLATLAGGVAHDFNNLLVTVMGWADVVMEAPGDEQTVREGVERIRSSARRATELARQMLAYTGRGRFEKEPTDLTQLVGEMAELLRASMNKSVTLHDDLADDLPTVHADATQLRQVVLNLVTNAAEALEETGGGIVQLRTRLRTVDDLAAGGEETPHPGPGGGTYVVLEVEDDGPGMDEETRRRVFDPFFTTKFTGRGLGLAATLGIVRAHGGTITVDSEPGAGTVFRVFLDVGGEEVSTEEEARSGAGEDADQPATVLVVDDEEDVRQVARLMLKRAGYAVVEARDGREAVAVFTRSQPEVDVVLMDLTMPVMGGEDALRELRTIDPDLPAVFFSGYDETEVTETLENAEAPTAFLPKPFSKDALLAHIGRVLGEGRQRVTDAGGTG